MAVREHFPTANRVTSDFHDPPADASARSLPARRADYRRYAPVQTRWGDNDVYGHVNNVVYYAYFDTVVNRMLIDAGLLDPLRGPVIGLVVETRCTYHAPLAFPEPIDAGLRVAKLGTSSVRYEIGLFAAGAETAAACGWFTHVYVDRATRRPTPLPAALADFLRALT